MESQAISTSNGNCSESALERLRLSRELSAELMTRFQDFHSLLDRLLDSSSPGSRGVPACSLPGSGSQAA